MASRAGGCSAPPDWPPGRAIRQAGGCAGADRDSARLCVWHAFGRENVRLLRTIGTNDIGRASLARYDQALKGTLVAAGDSSTRLTVPGIGGAASLAGSAVESPPCTPAQASVLPERIEFLGYSPRSSNVVSATIGSTIQATVGICGILAWLVMLLLGRRVWIAAIAAIGVGLAVAVVMIVNSVRRRRRRKAGEAARKAMGASQLGRLVVACDEAERAEFDEIPDTPFEPRVYWAYLAAPPIGWMEAVNWVGASLLFLPVILMPGFRTITGNVPGFFAMWAIYGMLRVTTACLWPAYYRVLPGRAELLRFRPFRREPMSVTRIDLRNQRVIVDTFIPTLLVESLDSPPVGPGASPTKATRDAHTNNGMPPELPFLFLADKAGFARALVMAARSTAAAGPVRDDDLAG